MLRRKNSTFTENEAEVVKDVRTVKAEFEESIRTLKDEFEAQDKMARDEMLEAKIQKGNSLSIHLVNLLSYMRATIM